MPRRPTGRPPGRPKTTPALPEADAEDTGPQSVSEAQRYVEDFVAANTKTYLERLHRIALGSDPKEARLAIQQLQDRAMGKASVPERDSGLEKIEGILKTVAEIAHGVREPIRVIEGSARTVLPAGPLRLPAADADGDGAGRPADSTAG